jgi:hypothetical protein
MKKTVYFVPWKFEQALLPFDLAHHAEPAVCVGVIEGLTATATACDMRGFPPVARFSSAFAALLAKCWAKGAGSKCKSKTVVLTAFYSSPVKEVRLPGNVSVMRNHCGSSMGDVPSTVKLREPRVSAT